MIDHYHTAINGLPPWSYPLDPVGVVLGVPCQDLTPPLERYVGMVCINCSSLSKHDSLTSQTQFRKRGKGY